jgi:hypothetical protein
VNERLMLAFLLAAALSLAPPHGGKLEGRWQLGHGYTAVVYRVPAGFHPPTRMFEIVRAGHVVRRWRPHYGSMGMEVLPVDLNGDGIKDVLVYSDIGGSGGCGSYKLYGGHGLKRLWGLRDVCSDTAGVAVGRTRLDVWHAIYSSKTKASGSGIHCCWRLWRHWEWKWRDGRFQVVERNVTKHRPPYREGPIHE